MSLASAHSANERPLVFDCDGDELLAVVHEGATGSAGLICAAGGGQYRVGSHRLYVQIARYWAARGVTVMRFDQRGVGDSDGLFGGFESTLIDIEAAVRAFRETCPDVGNLYLLGLCDSAAAALMAAPMVSDVTGLVLINPWVHSSNLEARTRLSRYYAGRLRSRDFWSKARRGELDIRESLRSFLGYVRKAGASARSGEEGTPHYVGRMRAALKAFSGEVLIVLSGQDLVAQQFRQLVAADSEWRDALDSPRVSIVNHETADHTFSYREHRELLQDSVLSWLA